LKRSEGLNFSQSCNRKGESAVDSYVVDMSTKLYLVAAAVLIAGCLHTGALPALAQTGEHGDGHAEMHDVYQNWHTPLNAKVSCCNNADCRPTRAFLDDDGNWHAWNGSKWLRVPQDRLLPTDYAGDGRSHLCEMDEFIYCFTPAEPKG
jgi:hypothetical protein